LNVVDLLMLIKHINKVSFRLFSRQQQDSFRNKLYSHLSCHIFCCLICNLFAALFAAFFAAFFVAFFGPDFWCYFLSMQYKSLLPFFRGWRVGRGVCVWKSLLGQHAAVKNMWALWSVPVILRGLIPNPVYVL